MITFELRDEAGTLKSKLDPRVMSNITSRGGRWRPYKRRNGKDTVCYEYDEDMVLDLQVINIPIVIYLWKGDKIIPVD